jgi:hypothetical protein
LVADKAILSVAKVPAIAQQAKMRLYNHSFSQIINQYLCVIPSPESCQKLKI